jgi:hypothetical protein
MVFGAMRVRVERKCDGERQLENVLGGVVCGQDLGGQPRVTKLRRRGPGGEPRQSHSRQMRRGVKNYLQQCNGMNGLGKSVNLVAR